MKLIHDKEAAADEFITYALVELADPNHTFYFPKSITWTLYNNLIKMLSVINN